MSQSRRMSLVESVSNVGIGFGVALAAQMAIFPLYGMQVDLGTNVQIGVWFTGISIARSYCVRRGFNWLHSRYDA